MCEDRPYLHRLHLVFQASDDTNATLYHVFPHNQHLFQLPACASQQVCNAVYLRLNFSTPLCG